MRNLTVKQIMKKQDKIWEDSYTDKDGIYRWIESDNIIPPDVFEEASIIVTPEHQAAYDKETAEFLADYRERMKNWKPSEEDLFEMRAAFGEGEEVVNVITGKKIKL